MLGISRGLLRRFLPLALPTSFQFLMLALVGASDAFMLGRLNQDAMSAVSLASQVQFLQNMMVAAIVVGLSVLGAQYRGRGDERSLAKVFKIGLRSSTVLSVIFALACLLIPGRLMAIFSAEHALTALGVDYLRIAGFSYFLIGVSQCCHSFLKLTDGARRSAAISTLTVLLNIGLNLVFIFGWGPIPQMGVKGAALATLAARVFELVLVVRTPRGGIRMPLGLSGLFSRFPGLSSDYWHCCLPIMGSYVVWSVGIASYTAAFGHLGVDAAAANAISVVVRDVLSCMADGGAVAAGIIVGGELGAGRLRQGRIYGAQLMRLSFVLGFASLVSVLLVTPVVLNAVALTAGAREHLFGMMLVLSVYQVGRYANTMTIGGIFSSGGDTFFDFYSLAVSMWVLAVPLALLGAFVFHWPVVLVFACTCIDEVGKIPWMLAHYRRYLWVRDLTRASDEPASVCTGKPK